jgi:hypothetical protein
MHSISVDPELGLTYEGRNGCGKEVGIALTVRKKTTGVVYLFIAPINSQFGVGPCNLEIPAAQLDDFIAAAKDALKEFEDSLKPQPPLQIMEA